MTDDAAEQAPVAAEQRAITALFDELAAGFGRLDPDRLRACYRLPCLMITARGVTAIASEQEFAAFFVPMMEGLKARGFARSKALDTHIKLQAETIALASILWARYDASGAEIERLGATYGLWKFDTGWRIVTLTAHAPETVLALA